MKLAICTMTKNQGTRLVEWVLYHTGLGFNKFIIYLDKCTDNSYNELENAKKEYNIDIDIYLTETFGSDVQELFWEKRSHYVYTKTINEYSYIDWIAFIEVDEFITPQKLNFNLKLFLENLNTKCVYINTWDFKPPFDTNKPILNQSDKCWTDKERFSNGCIFTGKSIIKPTCFKKCMDAHHFMQKDGRISEQFKYNRDLLQIYHGDEVYIDDNILRLSHYRNHSPPCVNYELKNNIKNVCVIGCGWYGCYVTEYLLEKYPNLNITIIDKNDDIFTESSYKNQNRLHLGFHYTQCEKTRNKCKKYFTNFVGKYKDMIGVINDNYYLISDKSNIPFEEYIKLYEDDTYTLVDNKLFDNVCDKIINTKETYINYQLAKQYFKEKFKNRVNFLFNYDVLKIENKNGLVILRSKSNNEISVFSKVFNCTYNQLNNTDNIIYEKCLTLLYKNITKSDFDCITVMDGNFSSLYYYNTIDGTKVYTLTNVQHTPLIKTNTFKDAYEFEEYVLEDKIKLFEDNINEYYPDFDKHFKYYDYFISFKCKNICTNNSRDIVYKIEENIFNVWSGKISFVFDMDSNIDKFLSF